MEIFTSTETIGDTVLLIVDPDSIRDPYLTNDGISHTIPAQNMTPPPP